MANISKNDKKARSGDYSKAKIYAIRSNNTDLTYVGSTLRSLNERLKEHRLDSLKEERYCSSKEIIDLGEYEIILLENFPCENENQLLERERFWIEEQDFPVNKVIPTRTRKEYEQDTKEQRKEYLFKNKEKIKAYQKEYDKTRGPEHKQYYADHREERLAYFKKHHSTDEYKRSKKAYDDQRYQDNKEVLLGNRQLRVEGRTDKQKKTANEADLKSDRGEALLRCAKRLISTYLDSFNVNVLKGVKLSQKTYDVFLNETIANEDLIFIIGKNTKTQWLFNDRKETLAILYNGEATFFKDLGLNESGEHIARQNIINFFNRLKGDEDDDDEDEDVENKEVNLIFEEN